jgi:hypothetical protein
MSQKLERSRRSNRSALRTSHAELGVLCTSMGLSELINLRSESAICAVRPNETSSGDDTRTQAHHQAVRQVFRARLGVLLCGPTAPNRPCLLTAEFSLVSGDA